MLAIQPILYFTLEKLLVSTPPTPPQHFKIILDMCLHKQIIYAFFLFFRITQLYVCGKLTPKVIVSEPVGRVSAKQVDQSTGRHWSPVNVAYQTNSGQLGINMVDQVTFRSFFFYIYQCNCCNRFIILKVPWHNIFLPQKLVPMNV